MWAESKRRAKMRLAFVGDGIIYNPESGLVLPDQGESELALLQRTLAKSGTFCLKGRVRATVVSASKGELPQRRSPFCFMLKRTAGRDGGSGTAQIATFWASFNGFAEVCSPRSD